jgi:hypothetical protein
MDEGCWGEEGSQTSAAIPPVAIGAEQSSKVRDVQVYLTVGHTALLFCTNWHNVTPH